MRDRRSRWALATTMALLLCGSACKKKPTPPPPPRVLAPSGDTFFYFGRVETDAGKNDGSRLFSASASAAPAAGEPRPLCDAPLEFWAADPMVSPDGTRIAFIEDGYKLSMIQKDCSGRRVVFAHESGHARIRGLIWSPDGKSLAYLLRDITRHRGDVQGPDRFHLMIASAEPGAGAPRDLGAVGEATGPAFTPDGQSLVFTSTWLVPDFGPEEEEKKDDHELGIVRIDGTGRRALKKSPHYLHQPSIFADGRIVLVMTTKKKGPPGNGATLRLVHTDAIVTTRLDDAKEENVVLDVAVQTKDPAGESWAGLYQPRFTPDGTRIFFVEGSRTHVLALDGKIESTVEGACATYSRDGRWIATWREDSGQGPIRTASKAGAAQIIAKRASSCPSFAP